MTSRPGYAQRIILLFLSISLLRFSPLVADAPPSLCEVTAEGITVCPQEPKTSPTSLGGLTSTIQDAIDAAHPGEVILVPPGTYPGSLRFNGKNVVVRSTGGAAVTTIVGDGGSAVDIGPGGELSGFTVTGGSAAFGAGILVSGTGTLIRGNIIQGNAQAAAPRVINNTQRGLDGNGGHRRGRLPPARRFVSGSATPPFAPAEPCMPSGQPGCP